VARFPSGFHEQPPLEHDILRNGKHSSVEHGAHPVREPALQFRPANRIGNEFNAKANFGQRYHADV